MDEINSLGQGINALIPPKNPPAPSLPADGAGLRPAANQQPSEGALEEKISEKVNDAFSNFPQDLTPPLNSIKRDFQEDFQHSQLKEDPELDKGLVLQEKIQAPASGLLEERIFYIEVAKIKPNPQQPRRTFPEQTIKELANSIREFGILEPLIVTRKEKETDYGAEVEYQLVSGERRLLAAKMLGLPTVPVIIRKPMEERKKLEMALIENIQREDLSSIAKAKAFARLIEEFGLTQQVLAERIGKSREVIANTLRLLQLSFEVQNALEQGRINEGHARAILLFANPEKRRTFLQEILVKNLSGRESLELAQHYLNSNNYKGNNRRQETSSRRRNLSLDPQDLELKEKLEDFLQTPVLIKKKGGQGAIEIKFFSQGDLDKILNKIFPS